MKKYFIAAALAVALVVPASFHVSASQLTQSQIDSIISLLQAFGADQSVVSNVQTALTGGGGGGGGTTQWCHTFNINMGIGTFSVTNGGEEIGALQQALRKEGLDPDVPGDDGYPSFGEKLAAAVTAFQEKYKDEILAPSGLKNGTGYVGKATRAKLNQLYGCGVIVPTPYPTPYPTIYPTPYPTPIQASLKVLSPNGGETWTKGTTQTIKWQDNTPIPVCPVGAQCAPAAPKYYDIKLAMYYPPCTGNICPAMPYMAPYTIAKGVYGSSYSWPVGQVIPSVTPQQGGTTNSNVPNGPYTIQACITGTNVCDSSDSYFKIAPSNTNQPPVISGVSGPTTLNISQQGTWTVTASDPENGYLSYSVSWGDGVNSMSAKVGSGLATAAQQQATFTHAYSQAGVYTVTFGVSDDAQLSAKSTITVSVGGGQNSLMLLAPNGGEVWQAGYTHTVKWTPYDPVTGINPASQVTAYLEQLVNGQYIRVGKVIECGKASIHWDGSLDVCGSGKLVTPGEYYVSIVNNVTGQSDRSDKPFTIVAKNYLTADLKINGSDEPLVIPAGGGTFSASWVSNAETCTIYNDTLPYTDPDYTKANLPPSGSLMLKLLPNTSWYSKNVTLSCSSQMKVEGGAYDYIVISPGDTSITVVSPNGGESLSATLPNTIQWSARANISKISIGLYKNDASYTWIVKDLMVTNTLGGSYTWVPSSFISASDYGNNIFKIYILGYKVDGGTVEDKSDAPFSIIAPTIANGTCTGLNLAFTNNKTTYVIGETVYYSYSCVPIGSTALYVGIQVVKPDGTATNYNTATGSVSSNSFGFGTSNLVAGAYTLRACFNANCQPIVVSAPFSIVSSDSQSIPSAIITSVQLTTNHLIINGSSTTYSLGFKNNGSSSLSTIAVQAWVEQGSTKRASGGFVVYCGGALGYVSAGASCSSNGILFAKDQAPIAGTGVFAPGAANAIFEIKQGSTVLANYTLPIMLDAVSAATSTGSVLGASTSNGAATLETLNALEALLRQLQQQTGQ